MLTKTSTNDHVTGQVIYHYTVDKFKIYLRKGNNKRSTFEECIFASGLTKLIDTFHSLTIPVGHRKYLFRISPDGREELIYSFRGSVLNNSTVIKSKEPQPKRKASKDMARCNILIHTLPEAALKRIMLYNYDHLNFPTKNSRSYLFKIMICYFFSLSEEDKIAFVKKARDRYEEYTQEVFNDGVELL